jgi:Zn-dependent protease with chaperone function
MIKFKSSRNLPTKGGERGMKRAKTAFFVLLFSLIGFPCWAITVSEHGVSISPKEWKKIGENAAEKVEEKYGVLEDPQQQARVDKLAEETEASFGHPIKILNTDEVNAFCLPDDWIYVTKGLAKLATDSELRFALRHEKSHAKNGDPEEKIGQNLQIQAMFAKQGYEGIQRVLASVFWDIFDSSFSRDKERRADAEAVLEMIEDREDPEGAISLLEKFIVLRKEKGIGQPGGLGKYLASHPPEEQRIELVREQIGKAKAEGFSLGPPHYKGHPIAVIYTVTSKEKGEELISTQRSKEVTRNVQNRGKFELIDFWKKVPEDMIDADGLIKRARQAKIEYLIVMREIECRWGIRLGFGIFQKEKTRIKMKVRYSLYEVKGGRVLKEGEEEKEIQAEGEESVTKADRARKKYLGDWASELLSVVEPNFTK